MSVALHPEWTVTPYGMERGFRPDMLGEIPYFLSLFDPRPARVQIDANYGHGGGWRPISAPVRISFDEGGRPRLIYPGDPVYVALAETVLRSERLFYYVASFVAVLQADGSVEVARVD